MAGCGVILEAQQAHTLVAEDVGHDRDDLALIGDPSSVARRECRPVRDQLA
jgi:hypothetical protein